MYHLFAGRVRAYNIMGYVEGQSDGVRVVPVGPSSGRLLNGLGCSAASNLVLDGSFESVSPKAQNLSQPLTSASLGLLHVSGGSLMLLPTLRPGALSGHAYSLGAGDRLDVAVATITARTYTVSFQVSRFLAGSSLPAALDIMLSGQTSVDQMPVAFLALVATIDVHYAVSKGVWMVSSHACSPPAPFWFADFSRLGPPSFWPSVATPSSRCYFRPAFRR